MPSSYNLQRILGPDSLGFVASIQSILFHTSVLSPNNVESLVIFSVLLSEIFLYLCKFFKPSVICILNSKIYIYLFYIYLVLLLVPVTNSTYFCTLSIDISILHYYHKAMLRKKAYKTYYLHSGFSPKGNFI